MNNRLGLIFCLLILSTHSVQLNLIVNGDFSYNLCPQTFCYWNTSTYHQSDVYGWLPDPQIYIGAGNIFTPILGTQKVLQLTQKQNSCVKQVFGSLNFGSYTINLEYTSNQNKQKSQNTAFNVYFNGKAIKTISSSSRQLQSQTIEVNVDSFSTNVELKFCGVQTSQNGKFGAILTKVELWGETKSFLRKEDPILERFDELSLRERSTRLLQASPDPTLPGLSHNSGFQVLNNLLSSVSSPTSKISDVSTNNFVQGFDLLSAPAISDWIERPALKNLDFNLIVVSPWKSNSNCSQSLNLKSKWSKKPSSISKDTIIKSGWNSNSECVSQAEDQDSTIVQNSIWVEKKPVQNLAEPFIKESSLWNEKPSDLKQESAVNSGWTSNSDCEELSDSKIISSGQNQQTLPSLSLIGAQTQGQSPLEINVKPHQQFDVQNVDQSSDPSFKWVQSKKQGVDFDTKIANNHWTSDSNCKENADASSNSLWTTKQSTVSNSQPLDPNNVWKSNSQCLEESNAQTNTNQKPGTDQKPALTLEQLIRPSSPENLQVISGGVNVNTQESSDSLDSATGVNMVDFSNTSPDYVMESSVLSSNGFQAQNPPNEQTNGIHSYHQQQATSVTIKQKPFELTKPAFENHVIEQLIQKPLSQQSGNLISNGDFQTYKCAYLPCIINEMIPGSSLSSWIAEPLIEIGRINQYNPSLKEAGENIGAHLGFSTKNTCIKQSLKTLTTSHYELSFDYAPVVTELSDHVSEAFFIVKFNGKNIKNVLCVDKLSHRQTIVLKGMRGQNIIEFCSFGSLNENPHGAIIDNISLTLKSNLDNLKTDLILNGDFENNQCYSKNCLWNKENFNSRYLPGWLPESQIQIGKGNLYNIHAGISTVAQLSPNSNSCIKQILDNCVQGSFKLTFSWAARQSESLHDSVFQVKVNNKLVQSYIPSDYSLHRENLVLNLNEGKNELKFCSFGMNNDKGAIIDDVSMFLIDSCSKRI